jgi:hypothetical protein
MQTECDAACAAQRMRQELCLGAVWRKITKLMPLALTNPLTISEKDKYLENQNVLYPMVLSSLRHCHGLMSKHDAYKISHYVYPCVSSGKTLEDYNP